MKPTLPLLLLSGIAVSTLHAAEPTITKKLNIQKSTALPAHLTTRIQWNKFPQPQYKNEDLKEQNRAAIVRIITDEEGQISKATVQESTGLAQLDQLLLNAVMQAQVKPYLQDGVALPVIGYQTFSLNLINEEMPVTPTVCQYTFTSKNWLAQKKEKSVPFSYRSQPKTLQLQAALLEQKPRLVKFSFKVNKQGEVQKVKLKKGSGNQKIDQQLIQAISQSKVDVPRKFWIYKPSNLQDQIMLDPRHCTS